jgi:hypothetical protein
MPDLVKRQREYKSKGLRVIGVTHPPEQFADAREFIKSIKVKCLKSSRELFVRKSLAEGEAAASIADLWSVPVIQVRNFGDD